MVDPAFILFVVRLSNLIVDNLWPGSVSRVRLSSSRVSAYSNPWTHFHVIINVFFESLDILRNAIRIYFRNVIRFFVLARSNSCCYDDNNYHQKDWENTVFSIFLRWSIIGLVLCLIWLVSFLNLLGLFHNIIPVLFLGRLRGIWNIFFIVSKFLCLFHDFIPIFFLCYIGIFCCDRLFLFYLNRPWLFLSLRIWGDTRLLYHIDRLNDLLDYNLWLRLRNIAIH